MRLLRFNGIDDDVHNDVLINPLDINAVRAPLKSEFSPHVRCVIFTGVNKFGVTETVAQVERMLEDYELDD